MPNNCSNKQKQSRSGRIKFKLIVSAFILLVAALGFNALLSISALEKLYVGAIASEYQVVGKNLQRKLEQALRFGKNIHKFVGINRLLQETKDNLTGKVKPQRTLGADAAGANGADTIDVSVVLPDGQVLYSADEQRVGETLAAAVGPEKANPKDSLYVKYKGKYYITLPLRDIDGKQVAGVVMSFRQQQIAPFLDAVLQRNTILIAIILLGSTLILAILLHFATPAAMSSVQFPRTRISVLIFLIIGTAQVCFSALQTNDFKNHYLLIAKNKAEILTSLLREEIEYLLGKGIRIDKLVKMEVLLGEIIQASPEIADITIYGNESQPLYVAGKAGVMDFRQANMEGKKQAVDLLLPSGSAYSLQSDIEKDGQTEGRIRTNVAEDVVHGKIWDSALDSLTVLLIAILFLGELLILVLRFIDKQLDQSGAECALNYSIMRPAAFLFLFGVDIGISFIPLHMEVLYQPLFGLSRDMAMGIPVSVRVFFTGFSIFLGGNWGDKRGWYEPFLIGLLLAAGGFIYAWLAPDAINFILSQALLGLGYGLSLIAAQLFIIAYTNDSNRATGLAQLWAGVYAGSICGAAAGAMLAERIGYRQVFLIGGVMLLLVIPYSLMFMRAGIRRPNRVATEQAAATLGIGKLARFLANRNVFSLILFSSLPASIALVGFLDYFGPVYLNRIDVSQSNIGRILMIYGVCLIYVAPLISKYVDASRRKKVFIVVSGIFGGAAFLFFCFFKGIPAASLAVFLLGISSSFGFAAQTAYGLKLNEARKLGAGQAMGIYATADRVGQVLGPVAFGWALMATGAAGGIVYFGLIYLLLTMLFLLTAQNDRDMNTAEPEHGSWTND